MFSLDELKNSIKDLSKERCQNLPYYSFPKYFHDHHSYALADVSNCFVTIFEHTFYHWFRSSDDLFLRLILCWPWFFHSLSNHLLHNHKLIKTCTVSIRCVILPMKTLLKLFTTFLLVLIISLSSQCTFLLIEFISYQHSY